MDARRPQLADLGLFLLVVAAPLLVTPFSVSPFGDPKLVAVAAGTLALWASGVTLDRPLAWAAVAWVGVTLVAALSGADPSVGLTAQLGGEGGGLIVVVICGVLVAAGAGLDEALRDRMRRWFVIAASVVAVLGIGIRFLPNVLGSFNGLSYVGATMGNQLFAAALIAAAIPAAMGAQPVSPWKRVAIIVLLTFAITTFGERSAVVLPLVGTLAFLVKARRQRRETIVLGASVVLALGVGIAVVGQLPEGGRGAIVTTASQATDAQRFRVWEVLATRAVPARPLAGWGPGSTQSAYLAHATASDVRATTRQWADAHDLLLETLVSTGILGLVGLAAVLGIGGVRSVRGPPERAWAFGAAAALGAYALVEPINLVLTPMLFLMLGAAAGPGRAVPTAPPAAVRAARVLTSTTLVLASLVSLQMLTASTFDRWGRAYGEDWAYRAALRIQPWRVVATERLAVQRAVEGRTTGGAAAGDEARRLIEAAVEAHPWDVDVRVAAYRVEKLLHDDVAAQAWIDRQIARFPGDAAGLRGAGSTTAQPTEPP
jgi:O-antigen ligase